MFNWHVLVIYVLVVLLLFDSIQSIPSRGAPFSVRFRRCAVNKCPLEYSKVRNSLSTITYRDYLKDCARYNCGIRNKRFFVLKRRRQLYGNVCLRLNCVRPALQGDVSFGELKRCISRDYTCTTVFMREMARRYGDHQLGIA